MTDDLVTRLKDPKRDWPEFGYDRTEAAARIEALVKEREAALLQAWRAVYDAKTLLEAKNALHALIAKGAAE